jgi:hypothetical protein
LVIRCLISVFDSINFLTLLSNSMIIDVLSKVALLILVLVLLLLILLLLSFVEGL